MDQMADETTPKADVKDKRRVSMAEDNSAWVREDKIQSEIPVDWRGSASAETEPAETSRGADVEQSKESDSASSSQFTLKMHLRRSSSAGSCTTENLSSSKQSNMGVDCADVVLNCLFCRFSDLIHMLPDSCERLTNHCCPSYKHVGTTVELESTSSDDDDICAALDCGLLGSCHDASDCLELTMEVSEICYH
ncbi:myoD family inhibitor domain-containing protein 2 [Odontesthes bonariensis]|uniref:myoD family inhibitor domain-containing protein 2 n=1 Tax=Odontesthes bonariensis TaxID=219752 RepID=UPI003F58FD90